MRGAGARRGEPESQARRRPAGMSAATQNQQGRAVGSVPLQRNEPGKARACQSRELAV